MKSKDTKIIKLVNCRSASRGAWIEITRLPVFGGKLTVAKEDYAKLAELAKKQIAAENRESELTAEVARLKKENEAAAERYAALERNARQIYPLKERLHVAENELGSLRAKFQRVMEFVEKLELTQKLKEFLNPRRGMHR